MLSAVRAKAADCDRWLCTLLSNATGTDDEVIDPGLALDDSFGVHFRGSCGCVCS